MNTHINEETYPTKVAGVFNSEANAKTVVQALTDKADFVSEKIRVIPPGDTHFDEKLEPEDKKIGKTLLNSHLMLGGLGLIIGLCIAGVLSISGTLFMQTYTITAFVSISLLCSFGGLLVAGFLSIRPDHDHMINKIRKATRTGKWSVIVHVNSHENAEKAETLMQPLANSLVTTI
ncbi:hypothetical protein [Catenovulum adriaticum]|uniref:Uncharacterized protein n=1 Tax=Catenovulum adriaticum TaxID=2984846 RepID=A0ABY7AIT3_9ALTE|nr:hypothetical protein [Catenovulum sp. TS8]WAJ69517.1 hypothetical protein OLW01_10075 [Catenovulum sp. TS8]